jgi:dTDP-4-dehydrorhamnose reductase
MNVLVMGAAGQLGAAMVEKLAAATGAEDTVARARAIMAGAPGLERYEVTGATRADVDLRDGPAVRAFVEARRPAVLINCAAYNNVDGAEDDPLAALEVNAMAVRAMAAAAEAIGATFVHYSTDFVFDGLAQTPYRETDPPRPQSTYGASKLLGEWFAQQTPAHYVLRVESLFGGPAARSSIDKIITALARGDEARVFVDRIVTPSYVEDVVDATRRLLARQGPYGLYHCANDGVTTWYEVGVEIARLLGAAQPRLVPVKVADVVLKARRPQYCALSNEKLSTAAGPLPTWQDSLARYLRLRKSP